LEIPFCAEQSNDGVTVHIDQITLSQSIEVAKAFIGGVVAWFAASIARKQSEIARNKLRLDLLDRRLECYRDLCGAIVILGQANIYDDMLVTRFNSAMPLVDPFFSEEISYFVETRVAPYIYIAFNVHHDLHDKNFSGDLAARQAEYDRACAELKKVFPKVVERFKPELRVRA
jgi:hypothetical protein